ncbi:MAG: S8 family peptidase, partial [Acidimicrobiia bacterium]
MRNPNDSLYNAQQWGLHYIGPLICGYPAGTEFNVQAPALWDSTTGSSTVRIAIVDSGIDYAHPDLVGRVDEGKSFVGGNQYWFDDTEKRHGTAVAGIAGARTDNSEGIAGLDWTARLVPVKVSDYLNGIPFLSWLTAGIAWTTSAGIPIVNLSVGTLPNTAQNPDTLTALSEVCLDAFLSGQLLVAASGNVLSTNGGFDDAQPLFPSSITNRVLTVGAILPDGRRWRDPWIYATPCVGPAPANPCKASNYGPWLDLMAPGGRFIATTNGGADGIYYTLANCNPSSFQTMGFSGTSAAAPVVSGAAALLKAYRSQLTGDDIEQLLKITALPLGPSEEYGRGLIQLGQALNEIAPPKSIIRAAFGPSPFSIGSL